jgi:hypothetical protein
LRVLVDGDQFAYSCGGATQKTSYDVGAQMPDGSVAEAVLENMDAVKAWKAEDWPEGTEFLVTPVVHAEPESHAIHLVKNSLRAIEREMDRAGIKFERLELYMTGGGNFREKIATIKPYKGNRDRNQRPYHYSAIRSYLARDWLAKTVHGYEADDALSIEYHKDPENVIIVSQDKDLRTFPGKKYNARSKTWQDVTPEKARLTFYRQLIVGDPVDNILGCYRAGEKAAQEITLGMTEQESYARVLAMYEKSISRAGCPYKDPYEALLENARLLHMLRHEGDVWTPPPN